jgi:pSer/pThr/pTyr-binding forkhead associated (FHA) protein
MDVGLVCDSCSTFNPMGSQACSRCKTRLSLDPPAATGGATVKPPVINTAQHAAAGTGKNCPTCSSLIPPGHRFCGVCGLRLDDAQAAAAPPVAEMANDPTSPRGSRPANAKKTMFFGAMQAARAKLVLIKGDGDDGVSFTLAGQDHVAGRVDAALLFEEDPFLSPTHANFFYREGSLVVRDEGSVNGVYIRIRGTVNLVPGDRFLVGEQLLEVQAIEDESGYDDPSDDGTYYFASPRRQARFRIVQHLRGGETGLAYRAQTDGVSIGREGNDINFPDDPFISGHHAQVRWGDGRLLLTDLDSKNGTFVRVRDERQLKHGDYVFLGQQLLRVEIV